MNGHRPPMQRTYDWYPGDQVSECVVSWQLREGEDEQPA